MQAKLSKQTVSAMNISTIYGLYLKFQRETDWIIYKRNK